MADVTANGIAATTTSDSSAPAPREKRSGSKRNRSQSPQPEPREGQCSFWVKKKRRYCNLGVRPGDRWCGEHAPQDKTKKVHRVPCPYDGKHTILNSQLEAHMKRCNSRPKPRPSCFRENYNVGLGLPEANDSDKTARDLMMEMSKEEFAKLVEFVNSVYDKVVGTDFPTVILDHKAMDARRKETHDGKHAIQQASLIGHMDRLGFLEPETVFVEFGCGKGELSNYVHMAVGDPSYYVLIDRKNFRMKFDRVLKTMVSSWERYAIDIKDLDLSRIELLKNHRVVGISKHLCGSATDITLRCLTHYLSDDSSAKLEGVTIALCCHQICKYPMYCNHSFLSEHGITEDVFGKMCVMSTWAVCGQRPADDEAGDDSKGSNEGLSHQQASRDTPSAENRDTSDNADEDPDEDDEGEGMNERHHLEGIPLADFQVEGTHWSGLSFEDRERLGYRCKRIFDVGRKRYLEANGFTVQLQYYVESKTSLENLGLFATYNPAK
ncbi:methyltransferase TRM13-domain-containing protein [Polychytrium aggregatum]|uniref:methyltransferase TRM13-domain-containing protein n=1 Tax=Polychytrium aggregatum TaxID=110093 RepID=UPI0022FE028E|nr:methyltransferase TRM13-domain-containing protein [Polychytrium aggregatum]KAI9203853.1 methyltransferase TRM13-domain-containing protein [Polychytrium aggregatum]